MLQNVVGQFPRMRFGVKSHLQNAVGQFPIPFAQSCTRVGQFPMLQRVVGQFPRMRCGGEISFQEIDLQLLQHLNLPHPLTASMLRRSLPCQPTLLAISSSTFAALNLPHPILSPLDTVAT